MNSSNKIEKIITNKSRQAWNDEPHQRKGDKRNKTKRDNSSKRSWLDVE